MRRHLAVGAVVLLAACTADDGLEPLRARVRTPDQRATLDVDGCGLDDDVLVLGASSPAVLLQLLLVLDGDEVDLGRSGLTVTLADRGTLGAGDAEALQAERPAGAITSASVRGDRIEVVADAQRVSADGDVVAGEVRVAARCTADVELAGR